jgi:hypothetical protein
MDEMNGSAKILMLSLLGGAPSCLSTTLQLAQIGAFLSINQNKDAAHTCICLCPRMSGTDT